MNKDIKSVYCLILTNHPVWNKRWDKKAKWTAGDHWRYKYPNWFTLHDKNDHNFYILIDLEK